HPATAERKDLHRGAADADGEPDDVDRPDRGALDRLALREPLDRVQPVAVTRRVLEPLVGGRVAHLALELGADRLVGPPEGLDVPVDALAVRLFRDVPDAWGQAALDVVVEARDPAAPARLRPLARPVAEHAVEHVERFPDLLRVGVGAEVEDAAPVALTREHD